MQNCIFCLITEHHLPSKTIYEDEQVMAFEDANPQAPVHILVVPRKHMTSLTEAAAEDEPLLGHLLTVAARIAHEHGIDTKGFRTVLNTGSWAGQSIFHVHLHLLGGRTFQWPPG
jgi:histidine triad (HIT) family protein